MNFWDIFDNVVLASGFWFFIIAYVIFGLWALLGDSKSSLWLSLSLLVPAAFFFAFQPSATKAEDFPFWLASVTLWISLVVSPILAAWGVWRESSLSLLMGTFTSVPLGIYLFLYPGTRFYLLWPLFFLLAAGTTRSSERWLTWAMLFLIVAFDAFFWLVRLGVFTLGPQVVQQ